MLEKAASKSDPILPYIMLVLYVFYIILCILYIIISYIIRIICLHMPQITVKSSIHTKISDHVTCDLCRSVSDK